MERYGTTGSRTEHGETERAMESAQEKARDIARNVSSEVQGRVEAAKEAFSELREKEWSEIMDEASNFVRRHPVPAVIGALFVGYGIGKLLGGGRE